MLQNAMRERFTDGSLNTASGPRVIVMAYDRLDRDLAGAIDALEARDVPRSHELLVHAQDLVHELLCMLDVDAWEHAPSLASIYQYVADLLVKANITKVAGPAIEARKHLAEIGDAFRTAIVAPSTVPPAGASPSAFAAVGAQRPDGFGVEAAAPRRLSVRA